MIAETRIKSSFFRVGQDVVVQATCVSGNSVAIKRMSKRPYLFVRAWCDLHGRGGAWVARSRSDCTCV